MDIKSTAHRSLGLKQFSVFVFSIFLFSSVFSAASSVVNPSFDDSFHEELNSSKRENFNTSYYFVFEPAKKNFVQLTAFRKISKPFPQPDKPYNRAKHFGSWIRPDKSSCLNTRGLVLKRDSKTNVSISQSCSVISGDWYDHYTNQNFTDASDLQIDHVVALKNAYMTGASKWDDSKRCLYANYLGNDFHLMSVFSTENLRKSDKSPSEYVPPHAAFVCQYLKNWLFIKYIWELRLTPREVTAIQRKISDNHCQIDDYTVPLQDVQQQRAYMERNKNLCR